MGKLRSKCGFIISDTTDNLPYLADIIPDQAYETVYNNIEEIIHSLIEETRKGNRKEWIKNQLLSFIPEEEVLSKGILGF